MIKVMFVCYGNICRSPMAEFLFKDYLKEMGEKDYLVNSSATSYEEIGNPVYPPTRKILNRLNIDCSNKFATHLEKSDYDKYDYFIGMEDRNVKDIIRIFGGDKEGKVYKLLDFTPSKANIVDPWYTGDFTTTFNEITYGIKGLYNHVKNK